MVGSTKISAAKELIETAIGGPAPDGYTFNERAYTPDEDKLTGIVFLLVDSMETRKEIWDHTLRYNAAVPLVIESRMALRHGLIYGVNPISDAKYWEDAWYPDSEVEEETTACGASQTMGPNAAILAGLMAWQFVHWWNLQPVQQSLIVQFDPISVLDNSPSTGVRAA